jgi:glucokinase
VEPLTMAERCITGAVDIGGTKIAVGVIDVRGHVLDRRESPTCPTEGFDAAMERVCGMLEDVARGVGVELCGIGIGCTGPVDPIHGVIGEVNFLPGWKGCNPVEWLAQRFAVATAMENDADAAVLAESRCGAGRGKDSIICVTVGTGIGGGIVLNGSLYRGVAGTHPEIGHHVIDRAGPLCFCGAHGCWEVLARGPAMVERMRSRMPPGSGARQGLTAKTICELARAGDAVASAEVVREGHYLGIGIANLVTLFAPQVITLGGSVMNAADLFMPEILATVRRHCGLVDWQRTTITPASLGRDTPLIGAGMVWRHRFGGAEARC